MLSIRNDRKVSDFVESRLRSESEVAKSLRCNWRRQLSFASLHSDSRLLISRFASQKFARVSDRNRKQFRNRIVTGYLDAIIGAVNLFCTILAHFIATICTYASYILEIG